MADEIKGKLMERLVWAYDNPEKGDNYELARTWLGSFLGECFGSVVGGGNYDQFYDNCRVQCYFDEEKLAIDFRALDSEQEKLWEEKVRPVVTQLSEVGFRNVYSYLEDSCKRESVKEILTFLDGAYDLPFSQPYL